jgi:hypothetical protein
MKPMEAAAMKRRIRQLKSLEIRIRYGQESMSGSCAKGGKVGGKLPLLWDEYFDLNGDGKKKARYTIDQLLEMDKEAYRSLANEFLFQVYYRSCQEKGLTELNLYDPELLNQLGLPYDADSTMVKKRFRELAKQYHPDAGGDREKFMRLMEAYQEMRRTDE